MSPRLAIYVKLQVQIYCGSGTVAHIASQWRHTRLARGFSRKDVMVATLKIWRLIRNPTASIEAYSLEEQSPQISSRSDLKRWSLGLFGRGHPNKKKHKHKNKSS